jgi:hypothetical protein
MNINIEIALTDERAVTGFAVLHGWTDHNDLDAHKFMAQTLQRWITNQCQAGMALNACATDRAAYQAVITAASQSAKDSMPAIMVTTSVVNPKIP